MSGPGHRDSTLPYRADIDGLRALAVLSVVLFHARVPGFSGGFAGVDVFFVISGYLITGQILSGLADGRFTLAGFYERRARRILPAMLVVTGTTLAAGWAILMPFDLASLARGAGATLLMFANILFWREDNYFDLAAAEKPLLHMWSLSVEEQFYLVFPLLVIALHRLAPRRMGMALAAGFLVSLALSEALLVRGQGPSFYLAPSRGWEFLAGALVAFHGGRAPLPKWLANLAASAGVAAILLPVFSWTDGRSFPGLSALPPVLGTAALIAAGPAHMLSRILTLPPVVFTGRISYSWYVWHYPILALAAWLAGGAVAVPPAWLLVCLSYGLAAVSWRLIEQPFRDRERVPRRAFLVAILVPLAALSAVAWSVDKGEGFPGRLSGLERAAVESRGALRLAAPGCKSWPPEPVSPAMPCLIGDPTAPLAFLLWSDSHGNASVPGLAAAARTAGVSGQHVAIGGCAPMTGIAWYKTKYCPEGASRTLAYIAANPSIRTVVLAGYWATWTGAEALAPPGATYPPGLPGSEIADWPERDRTLVAGLSATVARLRELGRDVIVVAQIPEPGLNAPRATFIAARLGRGESIPVPSTADYLRRNVTLLDFLAAMEADGLVRVIRPDSVLCADGTCDIVRGGALLYLDTNHLSPVGADLIAPLYEGLFTTRSGERPAKD